MAVAPDRDPREFCFAALGFINDQRGISLYPDNLVYHPKRRRLTARYSIDERRSIDGSSRCIGNQEILVENLLECFPVAMDFRFDPGIIQ